MGIYKPLYQKPVSSWHIISWCLKGLMGLGTPREADGKGWVSSSDYLFCLFVCWLFLLLLFSTSFSCISPPCFAKAFPYRCERLGEPWAWHHA